MPKWRHYRTEASKYGMELGAYDEVGHHMNGVGGSAALRAFIHAFLVSPQMGEVYAATFAALDEAGFDGPLAMSVECRMPDKNICHGLQRWLGDRNPAWAAVLALIDDAPATAPEPAPVPVPWPDPVPTPTPTPDPVPEPTPTPKSEPTPEEPDMADRQLLTALLALLKEGVSLVEAHLAAEPATPAPAPDPEPSPTPAPKPAPVPVPQPTPVPAPTKMLPSFRHVQDFGIDRTLDMDWDNPNMHIYLPNWAGGDEGNGVGGSVGTPAMIDYNADKSVTLRAGMVDGRWRTRALQVNRSQAPRGKYGAVPTSHTVKPSMRSSSMQETAKSWTSSW